MKAFTPRPSRFLLSDNVKIGVVCAKSLPARASFLNPSSICIRCQQRALSLQRMRPCARLKPNDTCEGGRTPNHRPAVLTWLSSGRSVHNRTRGTQDESLPESDGAVRVAPAEDLPSHKEGQKWTVTKRLNAFMDNTLARVAVAGHEINKYTGTDYTGVEALRREIKEQEELVRARREIARAAKAAFDEAQTLQMASQKEVVALLERKNSWASGDLERYMALIRSEHDNERGVTVARERLLQGERGLEEARTRLERRERAQYHEEQIWSDTIRRNSTWVTFGLMGFNVVLLLASIGIVEPWRRERLVREIRTAMEEKSSGVLSTADIETVVDKETLPGMSLEQAEKAQQEDVLAIAATADDFAGGAVAATPFQKDAGRGSAERVNSRHDLSSGRSGFSGTLERVKLYLMDFFSNRTVAARRVDLTALALESAVVGATLAASLLLPILRTR